MDTSNIEERYMKLCTITKKLCDELFTNKINNERLKILRAKIISKVLEEKLIVV